MYFRNSLRPLPKLTLPVSVCLEGDWTQNLQALTRNLFWFIVLHIFKFLLLLLISLDLFLVMIQVVLGFVKKLLDFHRKFMIFSRKFCNHHNHQCLVNSCSRHQKCFKILTPCDKCYLDKELHKTCSQFFVFC